ncbi:unnamed protein product [Leuciscus chuanchicus]
MKSEDLCLLKGHHTPRDALKSKICRPLGAGDARPAMKCEGQMPDSRESLAVSQALARGLAPVQTCSTAPDTQRSSSYLLEHRQSSVTYLSLRWGTFAHIRSV